MEYSPFAKINKSSKEKQALIDAPPRKQQADKPIIKEVSPHVRIVKTGSGMKPGDNLEIHEKVGDDWKKHWGTNEMSNDMASTEIREKAEALAKKRAQEKTKKMPVQSFEKEKAEHGYLSAPQRQKLIESGEYKGYMKKGGKVSTRTSSNKKSSW